GSAIAASIILIDTFLALWIMGVYARNSGLAAAGEVDGQRPVTLCAGRDLALPIPAAEDDRSGCRYRYGELRQIACGEDACMFLRRERDGSRTVVLVRLDNDVVVVGTPPPRRRSPALCPRAAGTARPRRTGGPRGPVSGRGTGRCRHGPRPGPG